jgi:hypothetical protein
MLRQHSRSLPPVPLVLGGTASTAAGVCELLLLGTTASASASAAAAAAAGAAANLLLSPVVQGAALHSKPCE